VFTNHNESAQPILSPRIKAELLLACKGSSPVKNLNRLSTECFMASLYCSAKSRGKTRLCTGSFPFTVMGFVVTATINNVLLQYIDYIT
jgi:hypothetical protein